MLYFITFKPFFNNETGKIALCGNKEAAITHKKHAIEKGEYQIFYTMFPLSLYLLILYSNKFKNLWQFYLLK